LPGGPASGPRPAGGSGYPAPNAELDADRSRCWQADDVNPDERAKAARLTRARLTILDAIDAALARYHEVTETIAGSADRRAAITAVSQLLDVDEIPARAILELQWGRLTRDVRSSITEERQQLARELESFER
jgi:DNA gyrase/topoisomerase IV subunit A